MMRTPGGGISVNTILSTSNEGANTNFPLPSPGAPVDRRIESVMISGSGNSAVMFVNGGPSVATPLRLWTYRPLRSVLTELATLRRKVQYALAEERRVKLKVMVESFIVNSIWFSLR